MSDPRSRLPLVVVAAVLFCLIVYVLGRFLHAEKLVDIDREEVPVPAQEPEPEPRTSIAAETRQAPAPLTDAGEATGRASSLRIEVRAESDDRLIERADVVAFSLEDGKFVEYIARETLAGAYEVVANPPAFVRVRARGFAPIAKSIHTSPATIRLSRSTDIVVRCVDPLGRPVSRVDVMLVPPRGGKWKKWRDELQALNMSFILRSELHSVVNDQSPDMTELIAKKIGELDLASERLLSRPGVLSADQVHSYSEFVRSTDVGGTARFVDVPALTGTRIALVSRSYERTSRPLTLEEWTSLRDEDKRIRISGDLAMKEGQTSEIEFVLDWSYEISGRVPGVEDLEGQLEKHECQYLVANDDSSNKSVTFTNTGEFEFDHSTFRIKDIKPRRYGVVIVRRRDASNIAVHHAVVDVVAEVESYDLGEMNDVGHAIRVTCADDPMYPIGTFPDRRIFCEFSVLDAENLLALNFEFVVPSGESITITGLPPIRGQLSVTYQFSGDAVTTTRGFAIPQDTELRF